jgi:hypothetical protein
MNNNKKYQVYLIWQANDKTGLLDIMDIVVSASPETAIYLAYLTNNIDIHNKNTLPKNFIMDYIAVDVSYNLPNKDLYNFDDDYENVIGEIIKLRVERERYNQEYLKSAQNHWMYGDNATYPLPPEQMPDSPEDNEGYDVCNDVDEDLE